MWGKFGEQIMADFPKDHINEAPPFTFNGADLFLDHFLWKKDEVNLRDMEPCLHV